MFHWIPHFMDGNFCRTDGNPFGLSENLYITQMMLLMNVGISMNPVRLKDQGQLNESGIVESVWDDFGESGEICENRNEKKALKVLILTVILLTMLI